jgi:flagellar biosynthesis/type III secretory pathway M-ring protein FliF/YscJ
VIVAEEVGPQLAEADIARMRTQDELARLFRQKPQAAAQVIRSWLVEE